MTYRSFVVMRTYWISSNRQKQRGDSVTLLAKLTINSYELTHPVLLPRRVTPHTQSAGNESGGAAVNWDWTCRSIYHPIVYLKRIWGTLLMERSFLGSS